MRKLNAFHLCGIWIILMLAIVFHACNAHAQQRFYDVLIEQTLGVDTVGTIANGAKITPGGIVFPRRTTAGRALLSPIEGQVIFNTDTDELNTYDGASWSAPGDASSPAPVGTIIASGASSTPAGYLYCDGSAVSSVTYADLFAAIGNAFGDGGDGAGPDFFLPDFRGRFLRGFDNGSGRDPDAALRTAMASNGNTGDNIGSLQADAFQGHDHSTQAEFNVSAKGASGGGVEYDPGVNDSTAGVVSDGVNGTPRTTTETRPVNGAVKFFIKY